MIEAGHRLFIEQGYEGTTLQDVVQRSGGSLSTIYKLFGSKEGLLDAVVFEKVLTSEATIREIADSQPDPAEAIRRLANIFHHMWTHESHVGLTRIVMARSVSDLSFAERFFERTALHSLNVLTEVFENWQNAGHAMKARPSLLAHIFWSMTVGDMHAEAMSHGLMERLSADVLEERTEFFLRGAGLA